MPITPKGDAARALLAGLPEFGGGDKPVAQLSDAYAQRLASAAGRQLASGALPSRQAARGHILTSEHPGGARPKLPERTESYRAALTTHKATALTGEATPAPSQRVREALSPEERREERRQERRPHFHRRERGEGHIPYADTGEIYTRNHQSDAAAVLRYAADLNNGYGERVVIQVYDCERRQWFRVFENRGHGQGINVRALIEQWRDHGGSLEAYLMAVINDDGSEPWTGRIGHICQFEITILPRETAAVKALRDSLKGR